MEKAAGILAAFRRTERNGMTPREILHIREVEDRATDRAAAQTSRGAC